MKLPRQNIFAWEVCVTLFHLFVLGVTSVRLVHRWQTKRMWWDDYGAFVTLIVDVLVIIQMWLKFRHGAAAAAEGKLGGFFYSVWFSTVIGWGVSWGSRCSLCLSIVRIFPEKSICRRFSFGLAITFFLSYIVNILTSGLACKPAGGAWYDTALICFKQPVGHIISWLFVVILSLSADILLILTPIVMLWKVRLPKKERSLILVLFASSVVSLLSETSFALVWFFVVDRGVGTYTVGLMFTLLQAAMSLLICNLLVITMLVYRFILRISEDNYDASRSPPPPSTPTHHNSGGDEKSNLRPTSLTTIYESSSEISSTPPATTSSWRDPESFPVSYIVQEGEIEGSSQMTVPPWSFSRGSSVS